MSDNVRALTSHVQASKDQTPSITQQPGRSIEGNDTRKSSFTQHKNKVANGMEARDEIVGHIAGTTIGCVGAAIPRDKENHAQWFPPLKTNSDVL